MAESATFAPFVILLTSLLAFPMAYLVSEAQSVNGELGLFVAGTACILTICLLNYFAIRHLANENQPTWLFIVFSLGTFASAVDLTSGLEISGYVSGFMTVYLKNGEPYLATPYGEIINYWDGTVHYILYAYMLSAIAFRWNYREVGLWWAGSIGHSMLILIPGAIVGKFGVRWSFLLNVPYIVLPFASAAKFLCQRPQQKISVHFTDTNNGSLLKHLLNRPFDLLLVISLIASMAIATFRGFAVLGCRHGITVDYLKLYEPYLNDPVAFPKVQVLVYLFYFVPFYIMAIYGLMTQNGTWLPDWALLFAGAAAQAQVPHILGALHWRTEAEYRIPPNAMLPFLAINLFLLIQPQLLAIRSLCFSRKNSARKQSFDKRK